MISCGFLQANYLLFILLLVIILQLLQLDDNNQPQVQSCAIVKMYYAGAGGWNFSNTGIATISGERSSYFVSLLDMNVSPTTMMHYYLV